MRFHNILNQENLKDFHSNKKEEKINMEINKIEELYKTIDEVVESYEFETLTDALAWALSSVGDDHGAGMALRISDVYLNKTATVTPIIDSRKPNVKHVMIIDCYHDDIKLLFGTPSKLAFELNLYMC